MIQSFSRSSRLNRHWNLFHRALIRIDGNYHLQHRTVLYVRRLKDLINSVDGFHVLRLRQYGIYLKLTIETEMKSIHVQHIFGLSFVICYIFFFSSCFGRAIVQVHKFIIVIFVSREFRFRPRACLPQMLSPWILIAILAHWSGVGIYALSACGNWSIQCSSSLGHDTNEMAKPLERVIRRNCLSAQWPLIHIKYAFNGISTTSGSTREAHTPETNENGSRRSTTHAEPAPSLIFKPLSLNISHK